MSGERDTLAAEAPARDTLEVEPEPQAPPSLEVENAEPRDTLETEEPDDLSFDPSDVRESSTHSSRHESHNFRKYSVPAVEKAEPRDTLETEEPDDLSFDPSDVRESSGHSSRHESHNFRKYSVPGSGES